MEKYRLIFITTFTDLKHIDVLLESINKANQCVDLLVLVVAQKKLQIDSDKYQTAYTKIKTLPFDNLLSLSSARNEGLKWVFDQSIQFDYMMFPDDDSSYSDAFFENFNSYIRGNTLIDVYCQGSMKLYKSTSYKTNDLLYARNYEAAMSVNMIIDWQTIHAVGFFDERMGVGAEYGAGEDADYFIRSCQTTGEGFRYETKLWNFHPENSDKYKTLTLTQLIKRYCKYGQGAIFLCNKHKLYLQSIRCCANAFAGSIIALLHGEFKLATARLYAGMVRSYYFVKLLPHKKIKL